MSAIDPKRPETWPVNPESSKGPRLPDPPDPDSRMAETRRMLDGLPKPPPQYASDDEIEIWLTRISEMDDGAERLRWVYSPDIFSRLFDPVKRGRQQHTVGRLLRAIDDNRKRLREMEAHRLATQKRDELADVLRNWREP